jgi:general secretion pathway protein C
LAKTFPRTLDPVALADWTGKALQRQGARVYGTGLTILLSSYFLADLTALIVEKYIPEPPTLHTFRSFRPKNATKSIDDYAVIFTRNLFNSHGLIPGDENSNVPGRDSGGVPIRTTLPLNLIGTIILRDELKSIATIEDKSANIVYPVRIQDEIPSKIKVIAIEPNKVVFVNQSTGRREFVDLPEDPTAAIGLNFRTKVAAAGDGINRLSETQFSIPRTEVEKALANLPQVLTQARAIPNFENGVANGYRLIQIVPGSIFDKLGLKDNDTICGVNGQSINDPGEAFRQFNDLKSANHLDLCVKRDGKQSSYSYDIPPR